MPALRYYSPQIRRDLITKLYWRAKAEHIPMTKLTDRLLEDALTNVVPFIEEQSCRVAEEPTPPPQAA